MNVISTRIWSCLTLTAVILNAGCTAPPSSGTLVDHAIDADCLTERETPQAPQSYYLKPNPLAVTSENIEKGKRLYARDTKPSPCANCHGLNGNGRGPMSKGLQPPPTAFTCKALMESLPDGQLFWVIENGSGLFELSHEKIREKVKRPGRRPLYTAMRGHKNELTEEQIWQIVMYLRTFSK